MGLPDLHQAFVIGSVPTFVGDVPAVSSILGTSDRMGTWKARWGIGRMSYTVEPGLYALGKPDPVSPVFVTANYKMSFDRLRQTLDGRSGWILVLDTKGINVWCAAGKGTFGTSELTMRIMTSGLSRVVNHRRLILPQLSAPGVAAHEVRRISGFEVVYGPVQSEDLPAFLDHGLNASSAMRRKNFPLKERAALIPIELIAALKIVLPVLPFLFFLCAIGATGDFWENLSGFGAFSVAALLYAVISGTVLTPLALPWIPGRAFSFKGLAAGVIVAALHITFWGGIAAVPEGYLLLPACFLLVPAFSSYLAMNFTGSSTYTSLSGVKKEMRIALPLQIAGAAAGLGLLIASRLVA